MHVTDRIKRVKRVLGDVVRGDMSPLDFRPSEIAFGAVLG